MYRVFLSYNTTRQDMVVVWRLQTLAAASGIHLDVPDPVQRADWNAVATMISSADSVIALLTSPATPQVAQEVEYAVQNGKKVIPIVESRAFAGPIRSVLQQQGLQIFELNPSRPWEMEQNLGQFLQSQKFTKTAKTALLALAGTAVGLLLLQEVAKSE